MATDWPHASVNFKHYYIMKKYILYTLLLFAAAALSAQEVKTTAAGTDTATAVKANAEKTVYDLPRRMVGLRAGLNFADMQYTHSPISRYEHFYRTMPMFGIFVQLPLGHTPLSLRPELSLVMRGDSLSWLDVNYGITARYIDLRLPLTYNFRFGHGYVSPYLMLAPQMNVAYGGSIGYSADDFPSRISTSLNSHNMSPADFSLLLGAGCDFTINTDLMPIYVSLEAGYNFGLVNNFSKHEIIDNSTTPSSILNNFFGAELWREKRYNRGAELALRVALPLDKEFLERYRKRRQVLPDTVLLVNIQTDTVQGPTDTVFITNEIRIPVEPVGYHTKECFSIAELYDLIEQGEDITGKRICMFDIKFDFDSYKIRPESEEPLNELVRMMTDYPRMTIEVYGHTDSIGTAEYNQKLSENRARAVVEYISGHGISPSRIKSFGYGLRYPIDTNSTEEGRFRNRRVEFEVIAIGQNRKYRE